MTVDKTAYQKRGSEDGPSAVVMSGSSGWRLPWRKLAAIGGVLVLVAIVAAAVFWWRQRPDTHQGDLMEQHTLQANLSYALAHDEDQQVIDVITKLINGKKAGRFTFSKDTLSTYYLEEGSAMMNLHEYTKAAQAYQNGARIGGTNKEAALQGEVFAGYSSGQRSQLIPILKQLSALASQHPDPFGASSAHYDQDIQALENGQKVDL